jgi:hypothetical protein
VAAAVAKADNIIATETTEIRRRCFEESGLRLRALGELEGSFIMVLGVGYGTAA